MLNLISKQIEFIYSTFDVGCSTFISFFSDQTGCFLDQRLHLCPTIILCTMHPALCAMLHSLSLQGVLNPCHGLFDILVIVKRADTNVSFAAFPKADSRGADHGGFLQQEIEKLP